MEELIMSKKILAILLCMLMVVTVFASCGSSDSKDGKNAAAGDGTIKIGMSGPLTGPAAVYGIAVQNAANMAVEEINANGGVNGYNLELIALDDAHDASKVQANYFQLIEDGMQVSLGCVTSNPCLEFCAFSEEDSVFFITPSASNDDVPAAENAYQMCFADGNQGKVAADYVNGLGYAEIGIFYKSDDSYSKGIYDQFMDNLDGSISVVETVFTDANQTDFTTQINTLKDCEFVFMPIYYTPASLFMTQAKDIMAANTIYYGCDGFDGIESAEGFDISAIPQEVTMLSHFNSKAEDGMAKEFVDKYTSKYGADTLNQFGASAYDCVYALAKAMEGTDITPESTPDEICEILIEVFQSDDFSVDGVTGTGITWDENGYVNKQAVKYVIKEATNA